MTINELIGLIFLAPFMIGIALFSFGVLKAMWAKIRKIK